MMTLLNKVIGVALLATLLSGIAASRTSSATILSVLPLMNERPIDSAVDEQAGQTFVATSSNRGPGGFVYVLDSRSGALVRRISMQISPSAIVADAAANRVFVVGVFGGKASLSILDTQHDVLLTTTTIDPGFGGMAIDRQLNRLFIAGFGPQSYKSYVRVFDSTTGRLLSSLPVPGTPVAIAVDERANRVMTVSSVAARGGATAVMVRDAQNGRLIHTTSINMVPLQSTSVDEMAGRVLVLMTTHALGTFIPGSGSVAIFDARSGVLVRTLSLRAYPTALAVDARIGEALVTTLGPTKFVTVNTQTGGGRGSTSWLVPTGPGTVAILNTRSGRILGRIPVGVAPGAVAVNAQNGLAIVANAGPLDSSGARLGNGTVTVVDIRQAVATHTLTVGVNPTGLTMNERAGRAFVINAGGVLKATDPWAWLPQQLRRKLIALTGPTQDTRAVPASISVLDVSRT